MNSFSALLLSFAFLIVHLSAQNNHPSSPPATSSDKTESAAKTEPKQPSTPLSPDDSVITIPGLCADSDPKANGTACQTTISRRQFEDLVDALNLTGRPSSPAERQNLAKAYAEYLEYEQPAEKALLENTAQYAEIMRWLRLRILTDLYRKTIYDKFHAPSGSEIGAYYEEHKAQFEHANIMRIVIPHDPSAPNSEMTDSQKKAFSAAQRARERAIAGEDPEQIQKDTYASLGIPSPPPTDVGVQARKDFVEGESDELFSLPAGGVSKVETELTSYVVYKVIKRETLPLDKVQDEIAQEISHQNIEKANRAITEQYKAEYNEKYFGPTQEPGATRAMSPPHP